MFPELYRAHHDLHPEDLPFWLRLARQSPGPILELGCGTGRVLLPIARAGYRIVGVERDAAMLSLLRGQLSDDLRRQVGLLQADFTRLRLDQRFGLILLPCNTYSTLTAGERVATLAFARDHLAQGGVFVVSMPSPSLLMELPARSDYQVEEIFPHPADGEPVQVSSGWHRTRREFILDWRYDHLLPDGSVESCQAAIHHQLVPQERILQEFHQAGFARVDTLGDFDFSPYTPDAEEFIILAHA